MPVAKIYSYREHTMDWCADDGRTFCLEVLRGKGISLLRLNWRDVDSSEDGIWTGAKGGENVKEPRQRYEERWATPGYHFIARLLLQTKIFFVLFYLITECTQKKLVLCNVPANGQKQTFANNLDFRIIVSFLTAVKECISVLVLCQQIHIIEDYRKCNSP